MASLPITFLSDYGLEDEFAGVCRAVICRVSPKARIIDITHGIPRHDVRSGAVVLAHSIPFAAPGVHLAVVDPGVGTERRPVAIRSAEQARFFVGPDNGLFSPVLERFGGAAEAVDLTASPFNLDPVSATFHGRDIFAPVSAALADGAELSAAGEQIDAASLARIELPRPSIEDDRIAAHVLHIDRFGNVLLDVGHDEAAAVTLSPGGRASIVVPSGSFTAKIGRTFADVPAGELVLYEDATRSLAIAINRGSAAEWLGVAPDVEVVLHPS